MIPGVLTGLAAAGAANYFWGNRAGNNVDQNTGTNLREQRGPRVDWEDYEDHQMDRRGGPSRMNMGMGTARPGPSQGEGSMRRATAFGSSSTR